MRILDDISDKKLDKITLLLTESQALELKDSLEHILSKPNNHTHVSNEDYKKEITVCIYNSEVISNLHPRIQKLILHDE